MPVTLPVLHDTYSKQLEQGTLDLSGTFCPFPLCAASTAEARKALELCRTHVLRGACFLCVDEAGICSVMAEVIRIALGRCPRCRRRMRLLPADLLPRKHYSLPVIEALVEEYRRGMKSLRDVAWNHLHGAELSHATLHAWTEGLGAYVLGRKPGEVSDAMPAAAVLAEAAVRVAAAAAVPRSHAVNPSRYRSEARQERLSACALLLCIGLATGAAAHLALAYLNRLVLEWRQAFGLGFRTGLRCTPIEHVGPPAVSECAPLVQEKGPTCPMRSRSPPSGSK